VGPHLVEELLASMHSRSGGSERRGDRAAAVTHRLCLRVLVARTRVRGLLKQRGNQRGTLLRHPFQSSAIKNGRLDKTEGGIALPVKVANSGGASNSSPTHSTCSRVRGGGSGAVGDRAHDTPESLVAVALIKIEDVLKTTAPRTRLLRFPGVNCCKR